MIDLDFTKENSLQSSQATWKPSFPMDSFISPRSEGYIIRPGPQTDYFQKTFYGFQNDNAPRYTIHVTGDFVCHTRVQTFPKNQYDQAGLICYLSSDHWLKTSCEFIPGGISKLGSVVTNNGFSDWSTQPYSPSSSQCFDLEFRLARLGQSYLIHTRNSSSDPWFLIRLAHLEVDPELPIEVGIYAATPTLEEGQDSGSAAFLFLNIRPPFENEITLHN